MRFSVALDAGHGGRDFGSVWPRDVKPPDDPKDEQGWLNYTAKLAFVEKEWVLNQAYLLRSLLKPAQAKLTTMLLRCQDTDIGLSDAATYAKDAKVDLAIILHCNTSENTKTKGLFAFHSPGDVAGEVVAEAIALGAPRQLRRSGKGSVVTDDWPRVRNVLNPYAKAGIPACLVEFGYISNDDDRRYLSSPYGQYSCAAAVLQGIFEGWRHIGVNVCY
jgi:N-acetylmuramoyl-L-alanine amidase